MNTYPQFKSSGLDWLNEIPSHWKTSSLKRIVTIQTGLTLGKVYDGPLVERPYLRVANVQDGHLDLEDITTIEVPAGVAKHVELQPGDVLMTEGGDLDKLGRGFLWNAEIVGCLHQNHIFALRCFHPKLAPKFLTYLTASQYGRDYFESTGKRTTNLATTNSTKVGAFPIPLPPIQEQQRIAAYLDASCVAIDAAVAAKRRQLETLDALRKSIVHRAVTKGLNPAAPRRASGVTWFGEIPRHWRCEHLKRFTKRIQAGMTPPTNTPEYYFDGTIPWFAPGSFNGDIDLREPRKLINELARSEGELRIFPTETVFLVGIGATIGKVGFVSAEASCNQQLIGIVCGHRIHSRFLAYQFKIYEDVIPGIATATTLPIFDQVKTGYLPTLQPPIEEQKTICAFLDTKLAESKQIVAGIESQIATLTAYRKSLIHECVTGQRRVTDEDVRRAGHSERSQPPERRP
ncbi:MAG: restriction endonuclease subunit S [Verrucomicrobia bacterium]|nr:restriction endonuclease subunit S [Verrucomicrobiota bacterium]